MPRSNVRVLTAHFTEEEVTLLIDTVKTNLIFWDPSNPEYKSRTKRETAWQDIASNIFEDRFAVKDLQLKWQSLRTQFNAYNAKSIDQASKKPITWKYFNKMMFIMSVDDAQMSNQSFSDDEVLSEFEETKYKLDNDNAPDPLSTPTISVKRKEIDSNSHVAKKIAFVDRPGSVRTKNSYHIFGEFIASELEKTKENWGQAVADRLQRKLNMCLINELDALDEQR